MELVCSRSIVCADVFHQQIRMIATFTRSSTLQRIQNTVTTFWMKGKKGKGKKKKSVNLSRIIISTIDYSPAFKNIN
jgi:hypothetical protein